MSDRYVLHVEFDGIAERIIRMEGFTFSLASKAGTETDLKIARDYLKQAIVKALEDAARDAKGKVTG